MTGVSPLARRVEVQPAEVWVCEHGDYEQRDIWGVYASVSAGVAHIKCEFGKPYIVRWDEPVRDAQGGWALVGHFEAVRGYSTEHTASFDFTRYEVERAA